MHENMNHYRYTYTDAFYTKLNSQYDSSSSSSDSFDRMTNNLRITNESNSEQIYGSSVTYPEIWRSPYGDAASLAGDAAPTLGRCDP
jgi:hypothetical protein